MFRFAIMGAGNIARTFSHAVSLMDDVCIAAVASKSYERSAAFARQYGISDCFDNYQQMLDSIKPDAVYIATMPSTHSSLSELCLLKHVPVLCEKAMFTCSQEAQRVLRLSRETNTFAMEGMWSRFLPVQKQAKDWLSSGRIGEPFTMQITIGCVYNPETQLNLLLPEHGGGAAHHLTVYAHELATYYFGSNIQKTTVQVQANRFGTDGVNQVTLQYHDKTASLLTSCVSAVEERLVIAGTKGRIILEHPHYTNEAFLYDDTGKLIDHFKDTWTQNGFVYEIRELIDCVHNGKTESHVITHNDTLLCSKLFDTIEKSLNSQ